MFRWTGVPETTLFGMTVKMYREPFHAESTMKALFQGLELDHYAYKYLGSELFMYKILDTNFEEYIEERGDVSRLKNVQIPTREDVGMSVL